MTLSEVVLLSTIQGLSEFLPISSSGHLLIAQFFLGIYESELIFYVSLHIGTLIAVITLLHKEIRSMLSTLINFPKIIRKHDSLKQAYFEHSNLHILVVIITGSIPTAIIGLIIFLLPINIFGSITLVGLMLILSGTILLLTTKNLPGEKSMEKIQIKDSLIIGTIQGIAIIPGISRSGVTISIGILLGIDRKVAGHYSFLLSIPAILGAFILNLYSLDFQMNISIHSICIGVVVSSIIGFLALKFLLLVIKSSKLYLFTPYCYLAGLFLITNI